MQLDLLNKLPFFSGNSSSRRVAEMVQEANLPQNSARFFGLLRTIYNAESSSQQIAKEFIKDKELLNKLLDAVGLDETNTLDIEANIREIEKSFMQSLIEADIARKFNDSLKIQDQNLKNEWRHCVKAAVIARKIATWVGNRDPEVAFMATLLSRVGSILMAMQNPDAYANKIKHLANGASEKEAEVIAYGFDHGLYAAKLFKHHEMPEAMSELAQREGDYEHLKSKYHELAHIIELAHFIADAFADKTQTPSGIWMQAQKYFRELHLSMTEEEWANKISLMFVKTLEFEMAVCS